MKTELQKQLAIIAPSISIRTRWSLDWSEPTPPEGPENWTVWQSETTARIIIQGEEIVGRATLGGTFEKDGDDPNITNPTISGYENQMTVEALSELPESDERNNAIAFILTL
jgi:hypothetical protein